MRVLLPPAAGGFVQQDSHPPLAAPARPRVPVWQGLFGSAGSAIVSLGVVSLILTLLPRFLSWAVVRGVWTGEGGACVAGGACWAFLRAKLPFILFGIYPPAEQWRPIGVIVLYLLLTLWTLPPSHWTRATLGLWIVGTLLALLLMGGGFAGLTPVPTSAWGGLPITVLLTVLSLGLGFPFGVLLALGRRSKMPVARLLSIGLIELVRGLPLITLLFVASILLPIMLPEGVTIDKLLRALTALTVFAAAYLAEVVRGGLQGIPKAQEEAAQALGLTWLQTMWLIVLPQAIRKVIPPLTNTIVVTVKNTSLVLVVGLFDLLSSGRAALTDPAWPSPYAETYFLVALIYFAICFSISRYSFWIERRMAYGGVG